MGHLACMQTYLTEGLMNEDLGLLTSSSSVSASLIRSELDCNTADTACLLSRINDHNMQIKPSLKPELLGRVVQSLICSAQDK